jgi:PDZ domain-containing protein
LWVKLLAVIGVLAVACVGLAFVPSGDLAFSPTEPMDLDGRIQVNGQPAERLQGQLYLVGVSERPVNLLQRWLLDVADPKVDFAPEPEDAPADGGPSQADVAAMAQAKDLAAAVALQLLGERVTWKGAGATVARVTAGPAASVLRPGDIIDTIDGRPVNNGVDAGKLINSRPPGTKLVLGMTRAGQAFTQPITTVAPMPGDTDIKSRIGVELDTIGLEIGLPGNRKVAIDSGEVVGPSGGLAFALYLYDSLNTREDLLRGRHVVATGAIAPNGAVLPVGRVRQKAIAAQLANRDVLLVPRANAAEAQAAVKEQCGDKPACVQVVPVASVADAVNALRRGAIS